MFTNMLNQDGCEMGDEVDPNKDISLLILLIMVLIIKVMSQLIGNESMSSKSANLDTNNSSGAVALKHSDVAEIIYKNKTLGIQQNGMVFQFPEDMKKFLEQGLFVDQADEQGIERSVLIIRDPDKKISGKTTVDIVRLFNEHGIIVDFHEVLKE